MNELVIIGKTVSTFGIKGELKVISDFEYIDKAFQKNKKILLNNTEHTITSVRKHKQYILLGIDNLDNINLVLEYVGFNIYMAKRDIHLEESEFLYQDLIGASVIDEDNTNLGSVLEVIKGIANDFIKVKGSKEFLIPLVDQYFKAFDQDTKTIFTINAKDLII